MNIEIAVGKQYRLMSNNHFEGYKSGDVCEVMHIDETYQDQEYPGDRIVSYRWSNDVVWQMSWAEFYVEIEEGILVPEPLPTRAQ